MLDRPVRSPATSTTVTFTLRGSNTAVSGEQSPCDPGRPNALSPDRVAPVLAARSLKRGLPIVHVDRSARTSELICLDWIATVLS